MGLSRMRKMRNEISCSCVSPSGELLLKGDPGPWIENNSASCLLVRCLMLDFLSYQVEANIADSIGDLTGLTHLFIENGANLELPDIITRLHNLQVLQFIWCDRLELPTDLGDLKSLRHLSLFGCLGVKSVPSIIGLPNLQKLDLSFCDSLDDLPANLGELAELILINVEATEIKWLPWSITKLPKLRFLFLPEIFRLEMLPHNLNESIIISVEYYPIPRTWNELREEIIAPLSSSLLGGAQNQYICSSDGIHYNSIIFPWGYLQVHGDPGPWIHHHYQSRSLVRFLDLNLAYNAKNRVITDSIGELEELTHLYIRGFLEHLPNTITRLQQLKVLSVECCRQLELPSNLDELVSLRHLSISVKGVKESIYSLEKLSHLETLSLEGDESLTELPLNLEKLLSLRHISLGFWEIKSLPVCITKLPNLTTLYLYDCPSLKLLPENLKVRKLKLRNCNAMSLPRGLCHMELSHTYYFCDEKIECDISEQCFSQLVNLERLAITSNCMKFLPSIASLQNLQDLQLRGCFDLEELPVYLGELVRLSSIDISGTRIKSLPCSITKLPNLQCLILPKCFRIESLPSNLNRSVKVVVDDTEDTDSDCETSTETYNEDSENAPGSTKRVFAEEISPQMPELLFHQVPGDSPAVDASFHNQEMEILPPGNGDWAATFNDNISAKLCAQLPEVDFMGGNCIDSFQNGQMANNSLENEHRIALFEQLLHSACDHGWKSKNGQSGFVNNKKQKIEITEENIQSCLSRNMKLVDASKELGVSRSTLKRKLKEFGIQWQSSRKRKQGDNANRKHNNEVPSAYNSFQAQLNLINPTNAASDGHASDCLDGENQHWRPDRIPFNCIAANSNSTPDPAATGAVEVPLVVSRCLTDGDEHGPEHLNGAIQCALSKVMAKNGNLLSNFIIKAKYKEDVVRFDFSSTASVAELKEEVAKNLELELDRFKIKYQDEEKEWMLMTRKEHLDYALGLTTSSGSNIVRLLVIDL